jgi:hypothetical protein
MALFTLMNRSHEVCLLEYSDEAHAFVSLRETKDVSRAPLASLVGEHIDISRLRRWWGSRAIPLARPGIGKLMTTLDIQSPAELLEYNHGLSLSDQYWLRPQSTVACWEDLNYFHNPFDDSTGRLMFGEAVAADATSLNTPDNSSDGNLPKRWIVKEDKRLLIKGGSLLNQEPYNEVIATDLYNRLLGDSEFVPYELYAKENRVYSACENMLTDEEEYVPALYVDELLPKDESQQPCAPMEHYLRCCELLGVEGVREHLSKMIVLDYLLANFDRHVRNFGLIRNVNSLEWRIAPLFDSGSCLWCTTIPLREHELGYVSQPFVHDPELQLQTVRDASWFVPEKLYGFVERAIQTLKAGSLADYTIRLTIIEDALYERLDRLMRTILQ